MAESVIKISPEALVNSKLNGATFQGLGQVRGVSQYPLQIEFNISNGNSFSLRIVPAVKKFYIGYNVEGTWSDWKEIGSWT